MTDCFYEKLECCLHRLADYPVLAKLASARTNASKLDGRTCRFIYAQALHEIDITQFSGSERRLFDALGLKAM